MCIWHRRRGKGRKLKIRDFVMYWRKAMIVLAGYLYDHFNREVASRREIISSISRPLNAVPPLYPGMADERYVVVWMGHWTFYKTKGARFSKPGTPEHESLLLMPVHHDFTLRSAVFAVAGIIINTIGQRSHGKLQTAKTFIKRLRGKQIKTLAQLVS